MDLYKIVYDNTNLEEEFQGVYAVSLVDDPANEVNFIALSKNTLIKLNNEPKKILTGVVLIPNQKIYRIDNNGREYEMYFEADVIEKLSQDFLRNGFQKNSTYNHLDGAWLSDISVVEQWIIEDPENDKSKALGFKGLPKGTWMISFKVSDEIWDEYVKTQKVKGFSIDAFLDMEKIKMNKNKIKKMSLLKRLRMALVTSLMKQISIEGVGELFSDNFEIGDEVFFNDELLISTSFTYEGFVYVTDDSGVIISIEEEVVEPQEEELYDEKEEDKEEKKKEELESIEEEKVDEIVDVVESIIEEVKEDDVNVEVLQEMVSFLEEKVKALETENEELKKNLSKTPNTTKLKTLNSSDKKLTNKESLIELLLKNKK